VTLAVRSVDGIFLQDYVPKLMCQAQVIRFLLHRGYPIPVPAVLGKIGRAYVPSSATRPRTRSRGALLEGSRRRRWPAATSSAPGAPAEAAST
jgi:hypothetical protein